MARKKQTGDAEARIEDIRHKSVKRKNIPPAKIAAEGVVPLMGKVEYDYSPRRPPVLRFDADGTPDNLPELLVEATRRPLTPEEARQLAEALRTQGPWLEWAGKGESQAAGFLVDPVALLIHERISAQAILRVAARQDVQRDLFSDPQQDYHEAVQFYRHDIDWTNRLILGDSLQVMASLARREDLAGKVQMIYMDPPYGIRYPSNFQPEVGKRDVKDKETDLTREPEMVKAYRDTWHLGLHSYLSYLRDRLVVAKELLADSGSIFVQISTENLNVVGQLVSEVFGTDNQVEIISFRKKTMPLGGRLLEGNCDYTPTIMRWLQNDRIGFRGGDMNLYRGMGNNPATMVDPTGEWFWFVFIAVLAAGAGGGAYGYYTGEESGTGESLVPGWGAGRSAGAAFSRGEYVTGSLYAGLAGSDAFMLGKVGSGCAKVAAKEGGAGFWPAWFRVYSGGGSCPPPPWRVESLWRAQRPGCVPARHLLFREVGREDRATARQIRLSAV